MEKNIKKGGIIMDYVFSDPHFGHTRLRLVGRPEFESDEQMHETIVKNYNRAIVEDNVRVYWLGDLGEKEFIEAFVPKMRGYKILILGNHDKFGKSYYQKYFDEVHDTGIFWNKRILLSHHPLPVEKGFINVHGHTHLIDVETGQHFNVCVERTDYKPVAMKKFEKLLGGMDVPERRFMKEWYADKQKPASRREDLVLTEDGLIDVLKTKELWKTIKPEKTIEKLED
jgi:calcineurin-like phosphoesterase family protein